MARGKRKTTAPLVSGPGAQSRRTDTAPAAAQPIRVPTGGPYGSRKALESQQRAVPLPAASGTPAVPPGGAPVQATPPGPPAAGVFGPTQRPNESPLAGAFGQQRVLPADPNAFLRILYSIYPHPDIARLLEYEG